MVARNDCVGNEYIPRQYTGNQLDAVEKLELVSEAEARCFFKVVKKRFLAVNQWAEIAQLPISTFKLTDETGDEISRLVHKGDFIKIDIPGPGNATGNGFDWVYIEELAEESTEETDFVVMRARPSANPQNTIPDTAHFLKDSATSTFQIKRIGKVIYAEEHGRNEQANWGTQKTIDNIRNTIVGWAAKLGLSYPQWKSLIKGWLRRD